MADVERDMAERAKELAGGRPSLLQDVMRGRRTEVQYLNGYVSEQGRQVGIPTPFNDKVVELITRVPPGHPQARPEEPRPAGGHAEDLACRSRVSQRSAMHYNEMQRGRAWRINLPSGFRMIWIER